MLLFAKLQQPLQLARLAAGCGRGPTASTGPTSLAAVRKWLVPAAAMQPWLPKRIAAVAGGVLFRPERPIPSYLCYGGFSQYGKLAGGNK